MDGHKKADQYALGVLQSPHVVLGPSANVLGVTFSRASCAKLSRTAATGIPSISETPYPEKNAGTHGEKGKKDQEGRSPISAA